MRLSGKTAIVTGDTPLLAGFMGEAAAFLCSDAASMITGVALEVDGSRCI